MKGLSILMLDKIRKIDHERRSQVCRNKPEQIETSCILTFLPAKLVARMLETAVSCVLNYGFQFFLLMPLIRESTMSLPWTSIMHQSKVNIMLSISRENQSLTPAQASFQSLSTTWYVSNPTLPSRNDFKC